MSQHAPYFNATNGLCKVNRKMRNFQDLLLIKFQVQQIDHRYPLV